MRPALGDLLTPYDLPQTALENKGVRPYLSECGSNRGTGYACWPWRAMLHSSFLVLLWSFRDPRWRVGRRGSDLKRFSVLTPSEAVTEAKGARDTALTANGAVVT